LSDQIRLTQARGTALNGIMHPTWLIDADEMNDILALGPIDSAEVEETANESGLLERLRAALAAQAQAQAQEQGKS
jgi:hypothetical protein